MKTIIYTVIILTIFSGCVTQKRCNRKFSPQIETIIKDSIVYKERITYKDTTIYVKLPADTVYKKDTITIVNGNFYIAPIYAETKLASAKAWIRQNKLNLMLADKDTTLEIKLTDALKTAEFWEYKYKYEKQTVKVKHTPKFWKFTGWVGITSLLLVLGYAGLKILRLFI